jgi:hypothetical protein
MRNENRPSVDSTVDESKASCYSISNATGCPPGTQNLPAKAVSQVRQTEGSSVHTDTVTFWKIWSETDRRLDSLTRCVREGVQVDEASNFARWLRFSGILALLQPFEQDVPLPIRAAELRRKCEDLIYECGEWYRLHERSFKPRDSYISQSKLEAIEIGLREIREALRLPLTATADTAPDARLHVMPGGAL